MRPVAQQPYLPPAAEPPRVVGVPLPPPPPPPPRRHFRWGWVLAPAGLLLGWWLLQNGTLDTTWDEVLCQLRIYDRERFSRLTALALLLCGGLAVLRLLYRP
jgi:hypothetical protein